MFWSDNGTNSWKWYLEKVPIITSGDGLYKDEYESGKYTYKGTNPNNYISFNGERAGWRIISIESDGKVKIIRNNSIGERAFGYIGSSDWESSEINSYLNDTYYYRLSSQSLVTAADWSIGDVNSRSSNLTSTINEENSQIWNGYIALPTVSEYIRANSNKSQCASANLHNSYSTICIETNWMYDKSINYWWLLSGVQNDDLRYIVRGSNGKFDSASFSQDFHVRPALYIISNASLSGGNGTENNPYTLSQ